MSFNTWYREKKVPLSLIRRESEIRLYNTRKRFDIAVFDRNGQALLIVECKAPSVPVTQDVLDQAVRYNLTLKVGFPDADQWPQHLYCKDDPESGNIRIIEDLPDYANLMDQ